MSRLKSKRYLTAVVLALSVFVASFYLAYAGVVQWSREQPSTVIIVDAVSLTSTAVTLFQDEELTDELTADEILVFQQLRFQPPLDEWYSNYAAAILYPRNDSDIPLDLFGVRIVDPDTGEPLEGMSGTSCGPCLIEPGEAGYLRLSVHGPSLFGIDFSVIIGMVGETTDAGGGVDTLSPQLQHILEAVAKQEAGQ